MNNQNRTAPAAAQSQRTEQRAQGSTYGRRKRPNPTLLKSLRIAIFSSLAVIALVAILLIVLPMFRVNSIEVKGITMFPEEDFIEALRESADVYVGQELFAVEDAQSIASRLKGNPKVKMVASFVMHRELGKLVFEVTEISQQMYAEQDGSYYVLSSDLRVLYTADTLSDVERFPKVILPTGTDLTVGETASFPFGAPNAEYITVLCNELDGRGIWDRVSTIDVSKKFNVSYVLEDSCRIKLGKVGQMDLKMTLVDEIVALKQVDFAALSVIDVSNTEKPTYRPLSSGEVLLEQ